MAEAARLKRGRGGGERCRNHESWRSRLFPEIGLVGGKEKGGVAGCGVGLRKDFAFFVFENARNLSTAGKCESSVLSPKGRL